MYTLEYVLPKSFENRINVFICKSLIKFFCFVCIFRTSVAPQRNPQQIYLQQSASPTPSYNFSSAINQFSQQQQQPKQIQQRPQQQFDTSYYNLYDDDDFYREDGKYCLKLGLNSWLGNGLMQQCGKVNLYFGRFNKLWRFTL